MQQKQQKALLEENNNKFKEDLAKIKNELDIKEQEVEQINKSKEKIHNFFEEKIEAELRENEEAQQNIKKKEEQIEQLQSVNESQKDKLKTLSSITLEKVMSEASLDNNSPLLNTIKAQHKRVGSMPLKLLSESE